jgi:hypothetical protein
MKRGPLFAMAVALFAAAPVLAAGNSSLSFSYIATGSFEPASFAFPDGTMGDSITLQGNSTKYGPITVHEWASGSANQTPTPCTLPDGSAGMQSFSDSNEVITQLNTGDVLLQNLVSGTNCVANLPIAPPFEFAGTLHVVNAGGTGKFANATGDETLNFHGVYYNCNPTQCWGYVTHDETP